MRKTTPRVLRFVRPIPLALSHHAVVTPPTVMRPRTDDISRTLLLTLFPIQYVPTAFAISHAPRTLASITLCQTVSPLTIAVETTSIGLFKILGEGDFLAHFLTQMLPDAEKYGLCRISQEGTFWEADAGIAYRRTSSPMRALDSFVTILRSKLSA